MGLEKDGEPVMSLDELPPPPPADEQDKQLIELYRQGQDSALDELFLRYFTWAVKEADSLVGGDPGGSERILAKAWVRYGRKLRRRPDLTLPVCYEIERFLKNEAYTWWESRRRVSLASLDKMSQPEEEGGQGYEPESKDESTEDTVERRTLIRQILKAFEKVPDVRWKAIFEARDILGLEGEAVDAHLRQQGITPPPKSTLSDWYAKAVSFIRAELGLHDNEFTAASRGRRRRT